MSEGLRAKARCFSLHWWRLSTSSGGAGGGAGAMAGVVGWVRGARAEAAGGRAKQRGERAEQWQEEQCGQRSKAPFSFTQNPKKFA